jgi:hypothetical protein
MMQVKVKQASIDQVKRMLIQLGANVRKEIAVVINKTAKAVKIPASRELGKILPVPSKTLKKTIGQSRRANDKRLEAVVILREGYAFPLRFFKPKQQATGIQVQMDKRIKGKAGRSTIAGAFVVKRYKSNIYKRKTKLRQSLERLLGPTPGQAFKDANIAALVEKTAREQLPKQLNDRIRYLLVRARGQLKGKQR